MTDPADRPTLADAFHERTQRCVRSGETHLRCAITEGKHRVGEHQECLLSECDAAPLRHGSEPDPLVAMQERVQAEYWRRLAIKRALVELQVDLRTQTAQDLAAACAANGWRMRDASGLYDATIETVIALVERRIDPQEYLATDADPALGFVPFPGPDDALGEPT